MNNQDYNTLNSSVQNWLKEKEDYDLRRNKVLTWLRLGILETIACSRFLKDLLEIVIFYKCIKEVSISTNKYNKYPYKESALTQFLNPVFLNS